MAAPTRLSIYNGALRVCGERRLASLDENRKPRHLLDQVWTEDNGVAACLEAGQWNFAMRTVRIDHDVDVEPQFGLLYAFTKPDDWVRTSAFCSDERFQVPLRDCKDEVGFWYSDVDPVYVRYVSKDSGFGLDFSLWPPSFIKFVHAHFANEIILDLTSDKEKVALVEVKRKKAVREALNRDAMNEPSQKPPPGSWVGARFGRGTPGSNDGGSSGRLIG